MTTEWNVNGTLCVECGHATPGHAILCKIGNAKATQYQKRLTKVSPEKKEFPARQAPRNKRVSELET